MNNKGFTLVELLVVVLIIGILTSVSLPQYTKAVEKARLTEALVNSKAILDAAQRYVQMRPEKANEQFYNTNIADVGLKGGSWTSTSVYKTKLFQYTLGKPASSTATDPVVTVERKDGTTTLYKFTVTQENKKTLDSTVGSNTTLKNNINTFLNSL